MNNKCRLILLLVFLFCSAASAAFSAPVTPSETYTGDPGTVIAYSQPGPEWVSLFPQNAVVLKKVISDLTGDGIDDTLLLAGSKEAISANYFRHLTLAFADGATGKQAVQPLSMAGYSPQLKPVFLLNKNTPAFLVSAPTGGSGGIVDNRIVSFAGGIPRVLFDAAQNNGVSIAGAFLPDYQVRVTFPELEQSITFDRAYAKADYLRLGLYTDDGVPTGKRGSIPWIDPFSALTVLDRNKEGLNRLCGVQQIAGAYHADRLATVTSTWSYADGQWRLDEVVVNARMAPKQ